MIYLMYLPMLQSVKDRTQVNTFHPQSNENTELFYPNLAILLNSQLLTKLVPQNNDSVIVLPEKLSRIV